MGVPSHSLRLKVAPEAADNTAETCSRPSWLRFAFCSTVVSSTRRRFVVRSTASRDAVSGQVQTS